jgi:hypothetical protein
VNGELAVLFSIYFGPIKNNKYSFRIGKRTLEDGIDENLKVLLMT